MSTPRQKKPMYRVGQVVRIKCDYYKSKEKAGERYQLIVAIGPWPGYKPHPFEYSFLNGDRCNEKWITSLSKKEAWGEVTDASS